MLPSATSCVCAHGEIVLCFLIAHSLTLCVIMDAFLQPFARTHCLLYCLPHLVFAAFVTLSRCHMLLMLSRLSSVTTQPCGSSGLRTRADSLSHMIRSRRCLLYTTGPWVTTSVSADFALLLFFSADKTEMVRSERALSSHTHHASLSRFTNKRLVQIAIQCCLFTINLHQPRAMHY